MATVKIWWENGRCSFTSSLSCADLSRRFKRTGKRNEIFLATKFGATPTGPNGKPEYVRASAEKSLKRLGVEKIDLYYLHVRAIVDTDNLLHLTAVPL